MNIDTAIHPDLTDVVTERDRWMRLYRIAVDRAVSNIGQDVYDFQPRVIQRALIAEEILVIVAEQDEDISDARVRAMTTALWQINGMDAEVIR